MYNLADCTKNKSNCTVSNFQDFFSKGTELINEDLIAVHIGKNIYQKNVVPEVIDIIMRIAQVEWYQLQNMVFCNNTLSHTEIILSRDLINKTFHILIESLQMCDCPSQRERYIENTMKTMDLFSASIIRINQLQDDILLKLSTSSMSNVKGPIYQYFHLFLNIQYYLLKLDYVCGQPEEKLENRVTNIMENLLIISKKKYKRNSNCAFICNCMKDMWLVIKLFIAEKLGRNSDLFWKIFNGLLENEEPIFALWILKCVSELETYEESLSCKNASIRFKPNYTLLESKLRIFFLNASSDSVIDCLKIVEPLLCTIWLHTARIEVFRIMWDYFSKRLNISNKKPLRSVLEFHELFRTIHKSPKDCIEDFEVFLSMFVFHLREHPTHWGKMKGRIYSQLGPNKLKDLNEIGIAHVMLLFLSLTSINYNELSKKITSFFEHLPLDKRNTNLVWNIYTAFIIGQVREGNDLADVAPPMLQMLQQASSEKMFHFIKEFITNFKHIISYSKHMQLHQWLLLNTWLSKYMIICDYPDLKITLDVLLYTLNQVGNPESWSYWEPTFKEHIYPNLKQLFGASTVPDIIGQICGKLCLLIHDITSECFIFFNSENVNPRLSCQFLNVVLESYPNNLILTVQQESLVVQSWFKIYLLDVNSNENLTSNVIKLDYFPAPLKVHLRTEQDPIYALIGYLGSDLKQHAHCNVIIKLCELTFGQADKWLMQYLMQPDNEVIVFRIYTCLSLAFLHCGVLLYDRNKATSPLTKLIHIILLPITILIGKPRHVFVLNAVKKTWHIFFEAIVKINNISDTFLERTLRDMIAKYMYYFPVSDSPFVKCLENESTAPVILDKICNLYFRQQVKEPDVNLLKALNIITAFVQSTTSVILMKLVVSKILYGVFEVIMFHSQRSVAANLVKSITCSPLFSHLKTEFGNSVLNITEKHLAFTTNNYFQLMHTLAKFAPADVRMLLTAIKKQISNVERKRGIGFDMNLRLLFEKLEISVTLPDQ